MAINLKRKLVITDDESELKKNRFVAGVFDGVFFNEDIGMTIDISGLNDNHVDDDCFPHEIWWDGLPKICDIDEHIDAITVLDLCRPECVNLFNLKPLERVIEMDAHNTAPNNAHNTAPNNAHNTAPNNVIAKPSISAKELMSDFTLTTYLKPPVIHAPKPRTPVRIKQQCEEDDCLYEGRYYKSGNSVMSWCVEHVQTGYRRIKPNADQVKKEKSALNTDVSIKLAYFRKQCGGECYLTRDYIVKKLRAGCYCYYCNDKLPTKCESYCNYRWNIVRPDENEPYGPDNMRFVCAFCTRHWKEYKHDLLGLVLKKRESTCSSLCDDHSF